MSNRFNAIAKASVFAGAVLGFAATAQAHVSAVEHAHPHEGVSHFLLGADMLIGLSVLTLALALGYGVSRLKARRDQNR